MSKKAKLKALALITTAASKAVDVADIAADKARVVLADAKDVRSELDAHKAVCVERTGNIDFKINVLTESVKELKKDVSGISNRIWAALGISCITAVAAVGVLVMYIISHVKGG